MKVLFRISFIVIFFGFTERHLDSKINSLKIVIEDKNEVKTIFKELNLQSIIPFESFQNAIAGIQKYNIKKKIIAICDFTKPSTEKRFTVIDLDKNEVLNHTYVAHGRNSGDVIAHKFSNNAESFQSSKGFFKISEKIISPKHGQALMLDGLEKGINDNARPRQIIMHGADYVCEEFINTHGRLGRSHGCPALPREEMKNLLPVLSNGALLYIYTKS